MWINASGICKIPVCMMLTVEDDAARFLECIETLHDDGTITMAQVGLLDRISKALHIKICQ
jgi:hypothetical protein